MLHVSTEMCTGIKELYSNLIFPQVDHDDKRVLKHIYSRITTYNLRAVFGDIHSIVVFILVYSMALSNKNYIPQCTVVACSYQVITSLSI